jgi:G3E family GTPase
VARSGNAIAPIYVIGGFLGSGKTTLLKNLVGHVVEAGGRPAVVMNEFAETDVDGASLADHHDDHVFEMRSIVNGCVCCDLSGELTRELKDLLASSEGPVFVETTGLASVRQTAAVIGEALGTRSRRGRLEAVIAVVDARRFGRRRMLGPDPDADIRAADAVVVNKVDGLSVRAVAAMEARVRVLNPRARVFTSAFGDVPPAALLDGGRSGRTAATRTEAPFDTPADSSGGFVSVTAHIRGPMLVKPLALVLARYQGRLARVKGFVRTDRGRGLCELQWVPGALDIRPRKRATRMRAHLVMVGRRMDWNQFVVDLDRCIRVPRPRAKRLA